MSFITILLVLGVAAAASATPLPHSRPSAHHGRSTQQQPAPDSPDDSLSPDGRPFLAVLTIVTLLIYACTLLAPILCHRSRWSGPPENESLYKRKWLDNK